MTISYAWVLILTFIRYVVLILIIDSLVVFLLLTHQLFTPWGKLTHEFQVLTHVVSIRFWLTPWGIEAQ